MARAVEEHDEKAGEQPERWQHGGRSLTLDRGVVSPGDRHMPDAADWISRA
jgi:hypothetical protein